MNNALNPSFSVGNYGKNVKSHEATNSQLLTKLISVMVQKQVLFPPFTPTRKYDFDEMKYSSLAAPEVGDQWWKFRQHDNITFAFQFILPVLKLIDFL